VEDVTDDDSTAYVEDDGVEDVSIHPLLPHGVIKDPSVPIPYYHMEPGNDAW
jgi:hypothetical protein